MKNEVNWQGIKTDRLGGAAMQVANCDDDVTDQMNEIKDVYDLTIGQKILIPVK